MLEYRSVVFGLKKMLRGPLTGLLFLLTLLLLLVVLASYNLSSLYSPGLHENFLSLLTGGSL